MPVFIFINGPTSVVTEGVAVERGAWQLTSPDNVWQLTSPTGVWQLTSPESVWQLTGPGEGI